MKFLIIALIVSVTVNSLKAQTKLTGNIFFEKLPNGLAVLVVEDNSVPLATLSITFKSGAYTEPAKYSGMTYMLTNMLQGANLNYGNSEMVNFQTSQLGMRRGVAVNEESTEFYCTLPSINIEKGLKYMNSAVRFPLINQIDLDRAKSVSDKELQIKESNPQFHLSHDVLDHLWGSLSSRKSAIGTHSSIQSATLQLLDSVRRKYFFPDNALLIIAGNVKHEWAFNRVSDIFSNWKSALFDPIKKWPVPEFKPLVKNDYFTVESPSANVPYISINWQGPDTRRDIQSTYSADVFSYILNQNSSKLNKALVQSGLAYQVSFGYITLSHGGPITLLIKPNPPKIKECMEEVKRQLNSFDEDDYITTEQIETAERKLGINQVRQEEITSTYVHSLAFWWASASVDYYFNYLDNLNKVKKTDLQAYIRKYIKNKPYCAGLLISPALKAQLNTNTFFMATH